MSELAEAADSPEVSEVAESSPELDNGFDMEAAQEELGDALFGAEEKNNENDDTLGSEEDAGEADTPAPDKVKETNEKAKSDSDEIKPDESEVKAPNSWKKEMAEKFKTVDKEVQDYIKQRESEMMNGVEIAKEDATLGRVMRDTMQPYSQLLKDQGIEEASAVKTMMNMHYRLSTSQNQQEKINLLLGVAKSYGIAPPQKDAEGNPVKVDPTVQNLQNEVSTMKQQLNKSSQEALQAARTKVNNEVSAFANDEAHPYFAEVSNEMATLIEANSELGMKEAYEMAIWANPVTRQKELDRANKESIDKSEKERKAEVDKAKKLKSTNVKGRNTKKAPTEATGTMDETMEETLKEIRNRT